MRALLICDDYWHPGEVAEQGLAPLGKEGWQFDVWKDAKQFDLKKLPDYPVVIFVKSNNVSKADQSSWMNEDVVDALQNYAKNGGGLLVVHSGTAGYREFPALHKLFGGLFIGHPTALPVTFEPEVRHEMAAGVGAFTEVDEHYMMDVAEGVGDVFLKSISRHGVLPAGWRRIEGRGRVCMLTPGHNLAVWLNPNFQRLLGNVLAWCAGQKE